MREGKPDKSAAVMRGLIIFSKNEGKGHIAIQNCSSEDVADCIIAAEACLMDRGLTPSQIGKLLDARAIVTKIGNGGFCK